MILKMISRENSRSEADPISSTVSSSVSHSAALEQIKEKLVDAQNALEKIDQIQSKSNSLQSINPTPLDIEDLVALDRAHQHLQWLDVISKILEMSKICKKDHDALVSCHKILTTLVEALIDSSCLNLRNYALKSLIYLRTSYLPSLETELEKDLETLNYPKCVLGLEDGDSMIKNDVILIKKFQKVFSVMDEIQLSEEIVKKFNMTNTDPALVILRPLTKRFKYHFCGTKKTNNPIKPEWYLQQVGTWLKYSKRFFERIVLPVDHTGSSFQRFTYGLCTQVLKKLKNKDEMERIMYDDETLSHMIDEVLTFSQEFVNVGVQDDILPLVILLDPVIFDRWISLERKFAYKKIDDIMLEENSWTQSYTRQNVAKSIETFVILLQSITQRFKHLSSNVKCQLEFVQLQSDLLEDMSMRLVQVVRQEKSLPLKEKFCLILNSSQYLIDVINSWSNIPLYLQLELAKYGEDHYTGLFKEVIDKFEFLVQDWIKTMADHMFKEVKSRSQIYKDIKWFSYNIELADPCPESLPMFQSLASQTDFVNRLLLPSLINQVITRVCENMSEFFIMEIILESQFSNQGCQQLKIDIEKGMAAIFVHFSIDESKLEAHFQLQDVIKLLNMNQANAMLLLETLIDPKQTTNAKDILVDVGINFLDNEQAVKILRRRVDLK